MADTKLSALTEATTLGGTDQVYVNDSGTSKRITVTNLDTVFAATTKTLTNKTVDLGDNTVTGTLAEFNTACQDNQFLGLAETVYALSTTTPELDPANGTIQTWTLTGNSTPTKAAGWAAGESMTLMVDDGSASTITWTTVAPTWLTDSGSAPTLSTSGYTTIILWKVGTTIYAATVG